MSNFFSALKGSLLIFSVFLFSQSSNGQPSQAAIVSKKVVQFNLGYNPQYTSCGIFFDEISKSELFYFTRFDWSDQRINFYDLDGRFKCYQPLTSVRKKLKYQRIVAFNDLKSFVVADMYGTAYMVNDQDSITKQFSFNQSLNNLRKGSIYEYYIGVMNTEKGAKKIYAIPFWTHTDSLSYNGYITPLAKRNYKLYKQLRMH
jgi:hypothetical protein